MKKLGSRMKPSDVSRLKRGVLDTSNYVSVGKLAYVLRPSIAGVRRYVDSSVDAPWSPHVKTPLGSFPVQMRSTHDVRTINEIFCRGDYPVSRHQASVIIDIGGNIGISALYFATRHPENRVHVWEPNPANLPFLRANVAPFASRVTIHTSAVAPQSGRATFEVEEVGRYGGLTEFYEHTTLETSAITVDCDSMASVVHRVQALEGRIDVIKIDTEGSEEALVAALPEDLDRASTAVYYENHGVVRTLE